MNKRVFEWRPEYEIDGDIIDWEHKKLFDLANGIITIDRTREREAEIKAIIKEFFDYVRYHFDHEEAFMAAKGYPALEDHQEKHALIIAEMNQYLTSATHLTQLLSRFRQLAHKWVVSHIMDEDRKIRIFLEEAKGSAPTS